MPTLPAHPRIAFLASSTPEARAARDRLGAAVRLVPPRLNTLPAR